MAEINLPVITKKILGIFNQENSLVLVDAQKVWRLAGVAWEEIGKSPEYDFGWYGVGTTRAYAICNYKLYERVFGTAIWSLLGVAGTNGTLDGDKFWSISLEDKKPYLNHYNPGNCWAKIPVPAIINFQYPYYAGSTASGCKLWFVQRQRSRDIYAIDKSPIPKEAVFELSTTGSQKDITANLGNLNRLGLPFGTVGNIVINAKKDTLYISTEEGISQKKVAEEKWNKIRESDGSYYLVALPDNSILASNINKEVLIYKDDSWFQGLPAIAAKYAAQIGSTIYIANDQAVVTIDQQNPKSAPSPKLASYLNILDSKFVMPAGENFHLIDATNNLFLCNSNKIQTKIGTLKSNATDLCMHGSKLLITTVGGVVDGSNSMLTVVSGLAISDKALIASNGNLIAVYNGTTLKILDSAYKLLAEKPISADYVTKIAFKNSIVYVIGYRNQLNNKIPVQSCFLETYNFVANTLTLKYKTWGFSGAQLATATSNDMADTRLYKVVPTDDGGAIVLGETAGGNTLFRWNGQELQNRTLITGDVFSDPYNMKSAHVAYIGIVDSIGKVTRGHLSIPRTKERLSNTNRVKTLSVASDGIYVGTQSAYAIFNRDTERFLGNFPAVYNGSDASFLKLRNDLSSRDFWFTPGNGEILHFDDKFAVIATSTKGLPLTTGSKKANTLATDTYLIVW